MIKFFVLIVVLSFFSGLFYYFYFYSAQIQNPVVSYSTVAKLNSPVVESTDSEVSVSCVLSYGTFFVSQASCDTLMSIDSSQKISENVISCIIPEGTFLITSPECDLLRQSHGSRDIMERIDE